MALQNLEYWYDRQVPRFLEQLVRGFSGFQYQTGYNGQGAPQLMVVPCTMAETNSQVAAILRNNSENTLLSAPRITVWMTNMPFRREDVQYPGLIESFNITERKVDFDTNSYTTHRGNAYTVQRLMPRPFQMDVQVDLWTTTIDQKFQIMEQILAIIPPSFDIQNSQNPIDWTALTSVFLEEVIWSSKTVPVGSNDEIDIATLRLRIPIWLSPPAKVKAQRIIQTIITNILDDDKGDVDFSGYGDGTGGTFITRDITTPGDHWIEVSGSSITLLNSKAATNAAGDKVDNNWKHLFALYGIFKPAQSSIWLYYTEDFENGPFVSGTLQYDPNDPTKLIWQIDPDTLPANTLPPLTALIDPLKTFPGQGLPIPTNGTNYLIANDIGPSIAWGNLTAYENDIITYNNGAWQVTFSSRNVTTAQLVLNLYTGSQLRWTGTDWVMSIDAKYAPGYWKLKL